MLRVSILKAVLGDGVGKMVGMRMRVEAGTS